MDHITEHAVQYHVVHQTAFLTSHTDTDTWALVWPFWYTYKSADYIKLK